LRIDDIDALASPNDDVLAYAISAQVDGGWARLCGDEADGSAVRAIPVASWDLLGKVATPNLSGAWQRFARFRVEREATDKILAVRSGQLPPANTGCSDGTWSVAANEVKFSRDIAVPAPGIKYALAYRR